jgi:hypothetical protein
MTIAKKITAKSKKYKEGKKGKRATGANFLSFEQEKIAKTDQIPA